MTPFPDLTIDLRAASFCRATDLRPVVFAYLSTLMFKAFCCRFLAFRSLVRRARFSAGVSSLRARCEDDEVANISSGASMVAVDLDVGRADSKVAVATLDMVDIVAFGCRIVMSNTLLAISEGKKYYLFWYKVSIAKGVQFSTNLVPDLRYFIVLLLELSVAIIR